MGQGRWGRGCQGPGRRNVGAGDAEAPALGESLNTTSRLVGGGEGLLGTRPVHCTNPFTSVADSPTHPHPPPKSPSPPESLNPRLPNPPQVLATPDSSSDGDYNRIEGVVAHEYFHNWTGASSNV